MPDIEEVDEDTAKEIQSDLEQSDEDVSRWMRIGAGVQLAIVILAIVGGLVASVATGIITPSIVVTATINIGWVLEYVVIGISAAIVLYIVSLVLIVLPGSMLSLLGGLAYGAAVAAGLVEENNNE